MRFIRATIVTVLALCAGAGVSGVLAAQSAATGAAGASGATQAAQPAPLTSLLGRVLLPLPANADVDSAKDRLAHKPDDIEALLAMGQAWDRVWRFRESIDAYSRASSLAPQDWRALSVRGQRYISTRQLDSAVADLEKARELAPESFHSLYHLGLAYYFVGRYADAAAALGHCADLAARDSSVARDTSRVPLELRPCSRLSEVHRYALASWRAAALMRSGQENAVKASLQSLPPRPRTSKEGQWFYDIVDNTLGRKSDSLGVYTSMSGGGALTMGYLMANLAITRGDSVSGCRVLRDLLSREEWPAFGYIGAESDIARGRCKGIR